MLVRGFVWNQSQAAAALFAALLVLAFAAARTWIVAPKLCHQPRIEMGAARKAAAVRGAITTQLAHPEVAKPEELSHMKRTKLQLEAQSIHWFQDLRSSFP